MELQQRLFDLRRKAGLSQEELANLLGVTRQAIQKWEAGTSQPDIDRLSETDLIAAKAAIETACSGAPRWIIRLLQFFTEHLI